MIDTLLYLAAGLISGILSGLLPGIHTNTISQLAQQFAAPNDLNLVLGIVAMNTIHPFFDFIPSILIGAPHPENYLSALPGHRLYLKGQALDAIYCSIIGSLLGTILGVLLLPLLFLFTQDIRPFLHQLISPVLIGTTIWMIFSEKTRFQKITAFLVVITAGALGHVCLSKMENPLFVLVTGFFGIATLLHSFTQNNSIAQQKKQAKQVSVSKMLKPSLLGTLAASLVSLFPAIGPSQAAFIVTQQAHYSSKNFLVLLGSLNAGATLYSFVTLFTLQKARTGSAAVVASLLDINMEQLIWIVTAILVCTGIAALSCAWFSAKAIRFIQKINYRTLTLFTIGILLLLIWIWHGFYGLLAGAIATLIGLLCPIMRIKRTHCMAFLILPTLSYYIHF